MCLPQIIKSFQNYRGVATTFYPTLVYVLCNQKCTPYLVISHEENLYTHSVLFLYHILEPNYVQFGAANYTVCGLPSKGNRILAAQEILSI